MCHGAGKSKSVITGLILMLPLLRSDERDAVLSGTGIFTVRRISKFRFKSLGELADLMMKGTSGYTLGPTPIEGIYVRHEKNGRLVSRAKLVRPGFIQVSPLSHCTS